MANQTENVDTSFSWDSPIDSGSTIMISAASFNALVDKVSSKIENSKAEKVAPGEIISANKINKLAEELWTISKTSESWVTVNPGDFITANIFQKLVDAANHIE